MAQTPTPSTSNNNSSSFLATLAGGALLGGGAVAGALQLAKIVSRKPGKRIAVVLSGCGVYDGAEITESTSVLIHCTRAGATVDCFAPDQSGMHVVDHAQGEVKAYQPRNLLSEAARITRGNIKALEELKASDYDAVIFPGGFGVAKNLCTWAVEGEKCTVEPEVERIVQEFVAAKKPLGFACIAPILAAKLVPGCTITCGQRSGDKWPYNGTVGQVESLGAVHKDCSIDEVCVDTANRIVSAPAYMYDAQFFEAYDSIGRLVDEVLKLL